MSSTSSSLHARAPNAAASAPWQLPTRVRSASAQRELGGGALGLCADLAGTAALRVRACCCCAAGARGGECQLRRRAKAGTQCKGSEQAPHGDGC